jgi:plasmid stabilization system protein ParE
VKTEIRFTDTAKEDLRNIAVYIAEQAGDKEPAIRFVNGLREKVKILETFPESGAVPDDRILKSAGHRFLVYKEYLIFYQYVKKENAVYLLAFFNAKRDYTRVMRRFIRK